MAVVFQDVVLEVTEDHTPLSAIAHRVYPLVAIAQQHSTQGISVIFYDNASLADYKLPHRDDVKLQCLEWHPTQPVIGIGWNNGEVNVFDTRTSQVSESSMQHRTAVVRLCWSEQGTRLVSIDTSGSCIGWKHYGNSLQSLFFHELNDTLVDIAFLTYDSRGDSLTNSASIHAYLGSAHEDKTVNLSKPTANLVPDAFDFYVGSTSGNVFYVSETGSCIDVANVENAIRRILYDAINLKLVVVTTTLTVHEYSVQEDGTLEPFGELKLGGKLSEVNIDWLGSGSKIVIVTDDNSIKIVDLINSDITTLQTNDSDTTVHCWVCDLEATTIFIGTSNGKIAVWKQINDEWVTRQSIDVTGNVHVLSWCQRERFLLCLSGVTVTIQFEQTACFAASNNLVVCQTGPRLVYIDLINVQASIKVQTEIPVKSIFASDTAIGISNQHRLLFYELNASNRTANFVGAFNTTSTSVVLHESSAYIVLEGKIEVRSFQGVLKHTISTNDDEGAIDCIHIGGFFLAASTTKGVCRVWDVGRRETRVHAGPKRINEMLHKIDVSVASICCNCKGTRVSMLIKHAKTFQPLSTIVVWNVDDDSISTLEFSAPEFTDANGSKFLSKLQNHYPILHYWDASDPRVLTCSTRSYNHSETPQIVLLSVLPEYGIMIQDCINYDAELFEVVGVQIPYYILLNRAGESNESPNMMGHTLTKVKGMRFTYNMSLRDFTGVENCDKDTREAIMTFSFYLTAGNMDDAYKAIKLIKNESVWENMARMCVKTKRLDVAIVCLGKLKHARGAMALQVAQKNVVENDALIGILALQLGMIDEAAELFESTKQYDLLTKLYQDCNQWEKAIEVAEKYDRIHLKKAYHDYAHYLEDCGDIKGAITMYEKSGTHVFEVPRLLFEDARSLEAYITASENKDLLKWWAQYLESIGEMDSALKCYEKAGDTLSLLRVHCYFNNMEKAAEIANETGDKAACFHLARQFENQDNVKEAVHFFTRAGAYSNAVRVCREQGMDEQLYNLALLANRKEAIEVAKYFEEQPGGNEKAVALYQRAGWSRKAAELALEGGDLGALQQAAQDLGLDADKALIHTTATRLTEMGLTQQAVELLASKGLCAEAVNMCVKFNVIMTTELADKLTKECDTITKRDVLKAIADLCLKQMNYFLAAQKLTEAGEKLEAMKALLKSGDSEKIIRFASVSRVREIFIMAANYLQALDWHGKPPIMKQIISFYTKAKDFESLAAFYESCAENEMEQFGNFEKALGALNEAFRVLSNSDKFQIETKLNALQTRMQDVQRFVDLKRLYDAGSKQQAIEGLQQYAEELSDRDSFLKGGFVLAFIIKHFLDNNDKRNAEKYYNQLQSAFSPEVYLDAESAKILHQQRGNGLLSRWRRSDGDNDDDNNDNEEVQDLGENIIDY